MSLPAAEVAADFRDALQDLRMNSRPEISNLTLIAKENTEYAEAISNELQKHIQSVSLDQLYRVMQYFPHFAPCYVSSTHD